MRHQQGASYIAILIAIIGFAFMAKVGNCSLGTIFR